MKPTEALGWKHGFPGPGPVPADLAVICCIRNAADWARSMHAKPWHTPPAMQRMEFGEFIRAPWETIYDRARYFGGAEHLVGLPLAADRDPETGEVFADLFALRRAKLAGLLSYLGRGCACVVLRMEEAQKAPEQTVDRILAALGQPPRNAPFRPVNKRLGSRFKPAVDSRPATPARLGAEDLAYLRKRLNMQEEAALGYSY